MYLNLVSFSAEIEFETVAYSVREGDTCTQCGAAKGICVKILRNNDGYTNRQATVGEYSKILKP